MGPRSLISFVASLEQAKDKLEDPLCDLIDQKMKADYDDARALPREEDMDQLLRYDRALQKKFDWALQKLLESQKRRKKAQAPRERSGFKRSVTSHYLLPTSNP